MPEMAFLKGEVNFKAYDYLDATLLLLTRAASVTSIVMSLFFYLQKAFKSALQD